MIKVAAVSHNDDLDFAIDRRGFIDGSVAVEGRVAEWSGIDEIMVNDEVVNEEEAAINMVVVFVVDAVETAIAVFNVDSLVKDFLVNGEVVDDLSVGGAEEGFLKVCFN
ncbi:hypothetical protein NDU88_002403 [Pleurodeles waltl]|uniref:Uncharacterized protein n=1 Tax=Pleurodeles waltl TaxID=8319 RepID=A0AAV7TLJ4_PLEWA|nr:hypothetical protein NDU88_002403 [Pleurodeles waltl]